MTEREQQLEKHVMQLVKKIHPEDLGKETSQLEDIVREALDHYGRQQREAERAKVQQLVLKRMKLWEGHYSYPKKADEHKYILSNLEARTNTNDV